MNTRTKGHDWERRIRKDLLPLFPGCQTSRYASREADDRLVDLVGTPEFSIQAKSVIRIPNLIKLFREIIPNQKDDIKVLAFKSALKVSEDKKKKSFKGSQTEFAVIYWHDFLKLIREYAKRK